MEYDLPPKYSEAYGGLDNPVFVTCDENDLKLTPTKANSEEDIWALPELNVKFTPWKELSPAGRVKRVLWHYIGKVILLLGFLYLFICSLSFLGDAFKLLGGKAAGQALSANELLSNPVAGLMIGVLGTVLLQSSSTTTSIVVSMVGSGELLSVKMAIPIVMGANIGTSVTNTIVSLGQITDGDDFRRAFAGATVHDVFNWLTVCILLPVEVIVGVITSTGAGYLETISREMVDSMHLRKDENLDRDFLKVITDPFTKLIIQLDKNVIKHIAMGDEHYLGKSVIKHCCDKKKHYINETTDLGNGTTLVTLVEDCQDYCTYMFEKAARFDGWSDTTIGIILLFIALVILCVCLICIVKLLHALLRGQIAVIIRKFVNANFPGYCGYFTGYLAILIGAGLTVLVQSSSIFTSSLTPLVGMGVISLDRMYPLTLGSNIGTTATGILAAFAQDEDRIADSLQIALCHLFFNITGILIFYPFPFFRPPINAAKFLGNETAKYRWFAVAYLLIMFFLLPAAVFGLSLASWIALLCVCGPIFLIFVVVLVVKLFQNKWPRILPLALRNWKWLPIWLRSLEPYDRILMRLTGNCFLCRKMNCCKGIYLEYTDKNEEFEIKSDGDSVKESTKYQNGLSDTTDADSVTESAKYQNGLSDGVFHTKL